MKHDKLHIDIEAAGGNEAVIRNLKQQMRRQITMMVIGLLVVAFAAFSFGSRSWFAMNREVNQNDTNIISDSASPSLFIRAASDNTKLYASSIAKSSGASLFPISTANLSDWYYASGFTNSTTTQTVSGYTYTINTPVANAYTRIASFTDAAAGTYTNTYEGKTRTAYYRSDVNLYTTSGNLDVYLNSVNPIVVDYGTTQGTKNLKGALRVGLAVGGTMKLIYAPAAESGTGNSSGAAANTFYAISGGSLTSAASIVKTSLTDYLAQKQQGSDVLYTATGNTKICTATDSGTDVTVYVWLEGTDAQALYGISDADLVGINVIINYVGVETGA